MGYLHNAQNLVAGTFSAYCYGSKENNNAIKTAVWCGFVSEA
jgi:hypothetical protein